MTWKQGLFLNIPLDDAALVEMWEDGDDIQYQHRPEWMDELSETETKGWRYCGNKSWAYIGRSSEERYWEEMNELEQAGVCLVGDEGDGCVTHFYIEKPEIEMSDG